MSEKSDQGLSELRERVSALVPSDETVRHAVPGLYWPVWGMEVRVIAPHRAEAAELVAAAA